VRGVGREVGLVYRRTAAPPRTATTRTPAKPNKPSSTEGADRRPAALEALDLDVPDACAADAPAVALPPATVPLWTVDVVNLVAVPVTAEVVLEDVPVARGVALWPLEIVEKDVQSDEDGAGWADGVVA